MSQPGHRQERTDEPGTGPGRNSCSSDGELVQAARRGDKRAFVEIVARHQAMVCGLTLAILGEFAASEDAAQDAFLTAWRKIHELRDPERLRAWLGQIARHAALGHLRRKRDHRSLEDAPLPADDAPQPDEAAATKEEATLVRDSLAGLPEQFRLPLVLFYREGQSVRAVAESLELSEDAVKQRLARGRELLRERMSGLVESVLTRTGPNAVFTMGIAVAIGALAAPATVAGSVFAAASSTAGSTSAAAATPSATSFLTSMSISKGFLAAAALVAVLCVPVGYQLSTGRHSSVVPRQVPPLPTAQEEAGSGKAAPAFENSPLFAEWRELHERHGTNAAAMPILYRAIDALKDPFRRRAFRTALIAEWVQVDPAGGLAFFLGQGVDETQRRQYFEEWLACDPQAAVAALLGSAGGSGWDEMARQCLPEMARRVPSRMAEVADRLPKPENYFDTNVRDAFGIVADRDLAGARKLAESVQGASRDQALGGVARVWAKSAVDAAIAWARGLPDGTDRDEVIRVALLGKASVDPAGALELAGIVPSGGRYAHASSTTGARVLMEAAQSDFNATVSWLVAHPGRFASEDLMGLSQSVTAQLNAGVEGFLNGRAEDGSLAVLLPAIESALLNNAGGQRADVWEWLKTQPETDATKALQRQTLRFAAFQDRELALRLVSEIPRTSEGDAQVQDLARCLLNGGNKLYRFDSLYEQAPERLHQPLIDAAFHYLSADNFGDPQHWIGRVAQMPEASRAKGYEAIARAWAQQIPEDAIAWTQTIPAGESRTGALAGVASAWAAKDAYAAAEWIAAMPSGPERDRSATSLSLAIAQDHPQEAWTWALSIGDASERAQAASRAVATMAARDPATARQWIEAAPLTPELKAELQSAIERTPPAKN